MGDLTASLTASVGAEYVLVDDAISEDYGHDEALTVAPVMPAAVVRPGSTEDVRAILGVAAEHRVPITARGSGTGLSGACTPHADGIVVSFERMNAILEIDTENHVAVVQPGVTLAQLDEALAPLGLSYPVYPGEYSASLGGNVATNAGGMRAVKYGVTRHQVLGLEAVLPTGEVIRTGGKFVKATTGYDLTQLIIGSEGTLALVTEATLRLYPRTPFTATILAPFTSLDAVTHAIPRIVASGIGPMILEYIDMVTLGAITAHVGLDLGIPDDIRETALAYLVVMMEQTTDERLDEDVAALAEQLAELDAIDVYVLPGGAAASLIDAREKSFWVAKANNADDIVDVVVPRASLPEFMETVAGIASETGSWIAGCGHAGDGNVHLSVFQADRDTRSAVMTRLFRAGMDLGGAISGEHGIGRAKRSYFLALEDPAKLALMRRIKTAFDPHGILNPGALLDDEVTV
ncbi:MAG: FAD-binding oxidoreductase [Acidimicrobiia bacterium]|nr:FAD-binding oxidoreductase [Acidimicrobiia bacterium]